MSRVLSLLLLSGLAAPAHAWEHIDLLWADEDFPVSYQSDIVEQGGCAEVSADDCLEDLTAGWLAWEQSCLPIASEDLGALPAKTGFVQGDGINSVTVGETFAGVLAFSASIGQEFAFLIDDQPYFYIDETDIVVGSEVDFLSHQDVLDGLCTDQANLRATLAHEVGHSLGMGHSCDAGEACGDAELRDALMYWSSTACELSPEPGPDDLAGIQALYGAGFTFSCGDGGDQVFGLAPLTVDCAVESELGLTDVQWNFGDGTFDEGEVVSHTWTEEGLYDVSVSAGVVDPECEGATSERTRQGYVRVCELPRVAFELEHVLGKTWDIKNETGIGVLGCITEAQWGLYKGDRATGEPYDTFTQWEFQYEFPEEGTWTLVLNVGGPAGTAAASATVEIERMADVTPFGCAHGGPGGAAWAALPLLVLLGRRRQRAR